MTRLQSDDVSGNASGLKAYDEELLIKTGHNLRQIACRAVALKEEDGSGRNLQAKGGRCADPMGAGCD